MSFTLPPNTDYSESLDNLVLKREQANKLYRAGLPTGMTDEQYDRLEADIRAIDPKHPTLTKGRDDEGFGTFYEERSLTMHMGSQNKALNLEELAPFFEKTKGQGPYHVSFKVDGLTSETKYVNGRLVQVLTGGDGYIGRDVTELAFEIQDLPKTIDMPGTVYVRGEIHLEELGFQAARQYALEHDLEPIKVSRNGAVGILRSLKNKPLAKYLSFKAFDLRVEK